VHLPQSWLTLTLMREPKFSDAPCFGKEFDSRSKICRVCLANKPCQIKVLKALGASLDVSSRGILSRGQGLPALQNQEKPQLLAR
jgi:hypothetical protein